MTWEEMYNNSLETIEILNKEIDILRAIVRVQLPIIEEDNEKTIYCCMNNRRYHRRFTTENSGDSRLDYFDYECCNWF